VAESVADVLCLVDAGCWATAWVNSGQIPNLSAEWNKLITIALFSEGFASTWRFFQMSTQTCLLSSEPLKWRIYAFYTMVMMMMIQFLEISVSRFLVFNFPILFRFVLLVY
jgi:hypothetical protein